MRQGHFDTAGAYLRIRERCLSGAVFSPDQGCSNLAAMAQDDAQALRLLQGGAERSIPEAELALAQWWIAEFARKRQTFATAQAASPNQPDAAPADDAQRRTEALQAQQKALETLALAAPHNPAAATRLQQLQAAWANLQ